MSSPTDPVSSRPGMAWTYRRPRLHRALNLIALMTIVAMGALIAFMMLRPRDVLDQFGDSIPNLIAYSSGLFAGLVALAWFFFCSRFSRRVVWGVTLPILAAMVGGVASLRDVHFDGDMHLAFEWRWQPTQDERLEQFRSSAEKPSASTASVEPVTAEDMPGYRGANRDGVVNGPPLNENWTAAPPQVLWKHPIGGGYSQFAIVGDSAITLEQRRDAEAVVCYDTATGSERWLYESPGKFDEAMGGPGPRSTPTITGGRVYVLGALGHLACLELADGKPVWSRNLLEELTLSNSEWGMTSSPLVLDDRLIVNIGGYYGGGLIAVRLDDGKDVWRSEGIAAVKDGPPPPVAAALAKEGAAPAASDQDHGAANPDGGRNRAGYASPILATIDGVPQIVNFDGVGLWAHAPDDGRTLWFVHFENGPGVNVAQPIVFPDGRVFIAASYNVGSRMLQVKKSEAGWDVATVWENRAMRCKMGSAVLVGDHLYGLDEGILVCVDPATGKRLWKGSREVESTGRYGHGQLLVSNGLLLVLSERGDLFLVKPQPDKLVELGRLHVLDGEKTWNPPAMARGKLYVRNHHEMACLDMCSTTPVPDRVAEK